MTTDETVAPRVASIVIGVPPEKVWEEITRTGSLQRAVYNTILDADLRPGGKMRYSTQDRSRVFVAGEILEVDPPRKLRHTYIFTMKPGPVTEVTWELEPVPEGCRVTITHAGWTDDTMADKQAAGWTEILGLLKSELETGDIPTKMKIIYWLQGLFGFALPKTTKREYVDGQGW